MKKNIKIKYIMIVLVLFILLLVGGTYAWLISGASTANGAYNAIAKCFTVNYSHGSDISGVIDMSKTYTGGKSTTVTITVPSGCTNVTASVYLHTNSTANSLYKQETGNAGRVTIVDSDSNTSTKSLSSSEEITLITGTITAGSTKTYTVYFWVDGSVATNSWANASYSGYIYTTYKQV